MIEGFEWSIRCPRESLIINMESKPGTPSQYNDLRSRFSSWLSRWVQHFKVEDLRRVNLHYVNLLNPRGSFKIQTASADTVIWASPDDKTFLRIVHPTFSELIEASSPNAASALVVLEHSGRILAVWPGDLELKKIIGLTSCDNLDILLGPHHGGPSDFKKSSVDLPASLKPKRAFMSVGTFNLYSHPRPLYVKALGKRGCVVRCSELTVRCDADRVQLREPVFSGAGALGLRANCTGVPCRGTFRVYFNNGTLVPDEFEAEHTERIFKLEKPLCLRGSASAAK